MKISKLAPLAALAVLLVAFILPLGAQEPTSWGALKAAQETSPTAKLVITANPAGSGVAEVKVMTRNMYLGARIDRVVTARSLTEVPALVAQTWQEFLASDFPGRAKLLAAEIAVARPHLVGLQEVSLLRRQSPGDYLRGNSAAATEVAYDFLEILLAELEALSQDYQAVAVITGTDVEVPSATGEDIRLTDRDVILARGDVRVANPQGAAYAINLTVNLGGAGGPPLSFRRAWASVDACISGRRLHFVSTHLETQNAAPIQEAQGAELLGVISASPLPVVLVGDFNSPADGRGTATYGRVLAAGFADAWDQANPRVEGLTCCHDDDLLNPAMEFNRRIDHIFLSELFRAREADIVGDDPVQRTPGGLWPSDHAGLTARVQLRPARRTASR